MVECVSSRSQPRCDTCKYWSVKSDDHGKCNAPDVDGELVSVDFHVLLHADCLEDHRALQRAIHLVREGKYPTLHTRRDFGCVKYEPDLDENGDLHTQY